VTDARSRLSAATEGPRTVVREFREFIARGNVIDLAVGVLIGGAFGKIISSFVDQVVMPPVGLLIGRVDFLQFKWVLQPADPARKLAEVAIGYGAFLNTIIQFLIIALAAFFMVKLMNFMRRQEARAPPADASPTPTETLLTEIRDLLKSRAG
jgi:large conductance mechanosensitive channel